jgi:CheY-like chemotaxis protein
MNESGVLAMGREQAARRLRILFVDDQVESARLMAKHAESLGHEAVWTSTEAEARALLSSQQFDGMVADYSLDPELVEGGGARLVAMVHSGWKSMPCVLFTGFSPIGQLATMTGVLESLGDVVVMQKPQQPTSVLSILRSLIDAKPSAPSSGGGES